MLRLCYQDGSISSIVLLVVGSACGEASMETTATENCGDGVVQPPELCDDGNNLDGDGCNNDCGPSGSRVWCKYDVGEDGNSNVANSVAADSHGNAFIVGHVHDKETSRFEVLVAKYSPEGEQLWLRRIPGSGKDSPTGYGSAVDSKDRLIVSAEVGSGDLPIPSLMRFSPSGDLEWTQNIDVTLAFANDNVVLSSVDRIAVFGYTRTTPPKAFLADLSDDGTLSWKRSLDDVTASSRAYALTSDQEGSWILAGDILTKSLPTGGDTQPVEFYDGFLRKYSPSGEVEWTQMIPAVDADHSIHVTAVQATSGQSPVALWNASKPLVGSGTRMWITQWTATGAMLSQTMIPIEKYSIGGDALIASADNEIFIAGTISPGDPAMAPLIRFASRHNSAATTAWLYQNELVMRSSNFTAIALAPPGYLYLAGTQGITPAPETRALLCMLRQ